MATAQDHRTIQIDDRSATSESPHSRPSVDSVATGTYRPSPAFRRALGRSVPWATTATGDRPEGSASERENPSAPGLSSLTGAALTVGVAAGFLELAVQMIQLHWLHQVGLSTLQHQPACGLDGPRGGDPGDGRPDAGARGAGDRRFGLAQRSSEVRRRSASWAWTWAGIVLGTLLFLGPLLAVRRLHAAAALVLAFGAGTRIRRFLVRPTPGWQRASRWAGAIALVRTGGLLVPAVGPRRPRGGAGLVAARLPRPEPDLDRDGHRPRRPHEPARVFAEDDARARGLGRGKGSRSTWRARPLPGPCPRTCPCSRGSGRSSTARGSTVPTRGPLPRWPSTSPPTATPPPASRATRGCATPPTASGAASIITSRCSATTR